MKQMANSVKKEWEAAYNRLKKAMDKILSSGKAKNLPQLALQPIRKQTRE